MNASNAQKKVYFITILSFKIYVKIQHVLLRIIILRKTMGKNRFLNKLRASGRLRSSPKVRRFSGGVREYSVYYFSSLYCFDLQIHNYCL